MERLGLPYMRVGSQNRYRVSESDHHLAEMRRRAMFDRPLSDNVIRVPEPEGAGMSAIHVKGRGWISKFQLDGEPHWTPGSPWKTKRHALEAEYRYRDEFRAKRQHEETCATFAGQWLDRFPRGEASTHRLYAAAARRFADHFGSTPLAEVDRWTAHTWALTVPRSVSRVIGTMYEDARNVGLVEANPFTNMRIPNTERKGDITPPTLEEFTALAQNCTVLGGYGREMQSMILFAGWTGLRQGELFALRWQDVGEEEITVMQSRKLDGTLGRPKGGRTRTVPLLPPARVLEDVPRRPDEFVFHSPRGKPLTKGTHAWSWRAVKARAGVDARWHDLRPLLRDAAPRAWAEPLRRVDPARPHGRRQAGHGALGHPSVDAAKQRLLRAFSVDDAEIGSATGSRGRGT